MPLCTFDTPRAGRYGIQNLVFMLNIGENGKNLL